MKIKSVGLDDSVAGGPQRRGKTKENTNAQELIE